MKRKWRIYRGPFRLYFNAHHDAPLVASVDQGTQQSEESVCGWRIEADSNHIESHYIGKVKDPEGSPCFWLEGTGEVVIGNDDWAYISK